MIGPMCYGFLNNLRGIGDRIRPLSRTRRESHASCALSHKSLEERWLRTSTEPVRARLQKDQPPEPSYYDDRDRSG